MQARVRPGRAAVAAEPAAARCGNLANLHAEAARLRRCGDGCEASPRRHAFNVCSKAVLPRRDGCLGGLAWLGLAASRANKATAGTQMARAAEKKYPQDSIFAASSGRRLCSFETFNFPSLLVSLVAEPCGATHKARHLN